MLPLSANHFTRADRMDQGVDGRHSSLDRGLVMPFASDPELTARREIKLLRIEVEQLRAVERMLRAELEMLRAAKDEDRKTTELLVAYVKEVEQLFESRDYPEQEAKRFSGLRSHGWFPW
jgi:predicted ribosome quality control (RQC) complex YloA/Tae2 family protein